MKTQKLGILFTVVGILIIAHHTYVTGRLFDLQDVFHHEFFEAIFITAGLVLLISSHFYKND